MGRGPEPRGVGSPVALAPPHPSPPCSPASLQATRALMVVAVVLGLVALGIAIMGMKCTHCGSDDKVQKARIAMTGGLVYVVAGEPSPLPSIAPELAAFYRLFHTPKLAVTWGGGPLFHVARILPRADCISAQGPLFYLAVPHPRAGCILTTTPTFWMFYVAIISPSGLAGLVACSWYGHQIVTDFYNPLVPMNAK